MRSCCRFSAAVVLFVFSPLFLFATELTVKVVDPFSAAVPGAQVEVFAGNSSKPVAIGTTSALGTAHFNDVPSSGLRIHVLAPGFSEKWQSPTSESGSNLAVTVGLQMAEANETVVVSATRTLLPRDESGASVDLLSGTELDTMRPVAANDALRFLPGAIVATNGQRGGLSSLFVRGGDSRYNKVLVDGVPVDDPGGTFDFGTLPLFEADRMEFLRGAQSTLYGSDAMTSVVQVWSRAGSTPVPELRFGADAGNYGTENGYASLSGANGRFDYNVFGNQFNTTGSGPNDDYSNSLEGANVGAKLNDWASLRLRARHDHSVSGVQNEWNFNGDPLLPPDIDQRARQNNLLGSVELSLTAPSGWEHELSVYEYSLHRVNRDDIPDRGCSNTVFYDCPFVDESKINRAGFNYQGNYAERSWTTTTLGFEFEDEHGTVGALPDTSTGLRRNDAVFGQQIVNYGRLDFIAGGRFVHNESFGNKFVPRASLTLLALKGGRFFSGTRLHFGYATGIKEPSLAESFGNGGSFPTFPNPNLKPEETRAFEAGFEQRFGASYSLSGTYFNNLFRNKIDFNFNPCFCSGQYINVNEAIAHGAEVELQGRPISRIRTTLAYTYTSTQILKQPFAFDPLLMAGSPLLRRPKHSATALIDYLGARWGADLSGSFVGRRADSDFLGFQITHAPGYVLVNAGLWYQLRPRITAYVNGENLTNRFYEEVVGYPALGANLRAGVRFRVGGE